MDNLATYQLKSYWRAPKGNIEKGEQLSYKEFNEDDTFVGFEYDKSVSKKPCPDMIIAVEGKTHWLIPKDKTIKIADIKNEGKNDVRYLGGQMQNELDTIKNKNLVKSIVDSSKGSVKGALWGLGIGLAVGLYFKKNLFIAATIGSVAGGYIGNSMSNKDKKSK